MKEDESRKLFLQYPCVPETEQWKNLKIALKFEGTSEQLIEALKKAIQNVKKRAKRYSLHK